MATRCLTELTIAIKGAGEMASACAWRLYKSNLKRIYMMEVPTPLAVRRQVCFCEALSKGRHQVESVDAIGVNTLAEVDLAWAEGGIPVIVDPEWSVIARKKPDVVIDAVLAKTNLGTTRAEAPLVIGLGPGFTAARDVHVVVETNRGHNLGRVLVSGAAEPDTGIPGAIGGYSHQRVLKASCDGLFQSKKQIGDVIKTGELVGVIGEREIRSEIDGIIRGLIQTDIQVNKGLKLGDIDPRKIQEYCHTISDKARAISGSVLQAVLSAYNVS